MSFFGELRRRNVVKVAVAYAIVGWLLIEVTSTVFPLVQLPEWTATFVAMLILVGFPIALILSWAYELTPEGVKKSHEVEATESITQTTGQKLNYAIIGALVLALGFVVYNYVLQDDSDELAAAAVVELEQTILPNSVAVLPFENLSLDPEDAFFATGIHEEVLNQLAKLSSLNVIARTSMMQYADGDKSIPQVAEELNVETVMEGSVRYADGRVLVTAQLIDPETNAHLWSDSYNREFADVFAIQSDIAMNIANALEAEFSLAEQESIEAVPTDSPEAYASYLRALSEGNTSPSRYQYLDAAIEADPEFALAYAMRAYSRSFALGGLIDPEWARAIQYDVDRALAVDPTLGLAYAALGGVHLANWRGDEAEEAFRHANELSPNNVDVLVLYGRMKRYLGDYDEAARLHTRALELDPNDNGSINNLGVTYRFAKDYASAVATLRPCLSGASIACLTNLAQAEVAAGNHLEAARVAQIAERLLFDATGGNRYSQLALVYGQIGRTEDARRLFEQFQEIVAETPIADSAWARAYIAVGDYEQALERLESAVSAATPGEIVALAEMAANAWSDPELDKPAFREVLDGLWDRE